MNRPRRFIHAALATSFVVAFAALGLAQEKKPSPPPPATIAELQQAIQSILKRDGVPGAGIALVAKDHVIWAGGVGKSDVSLNRDVTANTMFRVGSISKTFVGLALMKLVEEGKLNLNAPLRDVAPEIPFRNPWAAMDPVRVADVLEHTAGFDDMHPNGVYNVSDPPTISLLTVFQRASSALVSRWPPAERMAYSNEDYGIAGYLIEKITGEPYDKYIYDTILVPLGMNESGFQLTDAIRGDLAQGYEGNPPRPVPYHNIYLSPAGDFKSSPAEMVHLVEMFLNRGMVGGAQLLSPESITRMETPDTSLAARNGLKQGYGIANYTEYIAGFDSHGHNGEIDGFISTYRYLTDLGLGYVVFLNNSSSGEALNEINKMVATYITRGIPKPQPPSIALSAEQLQPFIGYYELTNPRDQMLAFLERVLGGKRIIFENGSLYEMGLFGKPTELFPVTPTQFRLKDEPGASRIFMRDGSGNMVYATQGFYGRRMSSVWPAIRLALLGLAFLLMLTSVFFALVWIPRKIFGRMRGVRHLTMRWLPIAALASLVGAFYVMNSIPGWQMGTRNSYTMGLCALTWLLALFSVVSLILSLRAVQLPEIKLGVRIHSLLVAMACCGIAGWLAWFGFIGIRFWRV